MRTTIVRDFAAPDYEACLAVFDTNVPEFFAESERAELEAFLANLPGPYLVLEDDDGGVVGCGGYALTDDGFSADLCWGMIRRDRHGAGFGKRLAEARLDRIRRAGARAVRLQTSQHTTGFYQRLGFVTERVEPNGFADGLDRCAMRLDLETGPVAPPAPGGSGNDPAGGRMALLVVDVQEDAVGPGLYEGEAVLGNIARLVGECRAHGVEVVYIQHDGVAGGEYEPGTDGWEVHRSVRPEPGERIVRKSSNSAFRGTDLRAYLESRRIDEVVIVGLHTPYCVDTTIRAAFEHGFRVLVPEMTNTAFGTADLTAEQIYRYHNDGLFRGRFAEVISMDDAVRRVRNTSTRDR